MPAMKKIFITGASSGIGNALAHEYAKRFADTGAIIGLAARRSEHLQKLAAELQNQYKISCAIYPLDVRDATALEAAAQDFMLQHGTPDIVIANAGVSRGTLTADKTDFKAIQAIFDIRHGLGLYFSAIYRGYETCRSRPISRRCQRGRHTRHTR